MADYQNESGATFEGPVDFGSDVVKRLAGNWSYSKQGIESRMFQCQLHARILDLTSSSDLKWKKHIFDTIKKANKRFYFIVQLKRAKVSNADILNFYCASILGKSCSIDAKSSTMGYLDISLTPSNVFKNVLCVLYILT